MEKVLVNIPSGYKFLSEVKDEAGRTFRLPNGILNKELTGCGGTTLALEDEFGIEISDEDAEHILTLGQVVDYVSEKIN